MTDEKKITEPEKRNISVTTTSSTYIARAHVHGIKALFNPFETVQ